MLFSTSYLGHFTESPEHASVSINVQILRGVAFDLLGQLRTLVLMESMVQ